MARKKNEMKAKEPVKLRFKKLSNANLSIYLDIYYKGKRYYEFLKLYLTPERFPEDRDKNRITLRLANSIKAQRIIDLTERDLRCPYDKRAREKNTFRIPLGIVHR